ncbi:hypothetical protein RH831_10515 [Halodesulfurarchaeum sp. HSR-GB]|uniref:hypothetical protein n=1 Tax=Halodesulfurarchaeum sp. HSR-GB TaxID=3074077 RepID=UPI002860AC6E|nr:hypothetical protein [Halodesulfurarchaeum sp. HSR-GB]MDR5657609.1 hypothetical protein [Halodesulfurarchaeum sp. HSR-GB]
MSDKTISIGFGRPTRIALITFILFGGLLTATTGTAMAQDYDEDDPGYALCTTPFIGEIFNFLINFIVYGGIVLGIIGFAGANLISAIPYVGTFMGEQVKAWQGNAILSLGKLLVIPAIIIAMLSVAGIGLPVCVDLAIWTG